jgi:HD-GYP domain-containing protein (c-di-GMP phosphodiesterase class II)
MRSFKVRPAADGGGTLNRPEVPTIKSLLSALRSHDPYTYRHSLRTVRLSLLLGRACGVATHAHLRVLSLGALAHDLGKILIPGEVLHKEERLTADEWEAVRRHPLDGARMLVGVAASEGVCRVAAEHHERWDGQGYPAGLSGERIDFNARVVAVADAFDAMTSERAYGPAVGYEEAAAELERCAGTQFDPEVVRTFLRAPRALLEAVIRPGREAAGEAPGD